MASVGAVIGHKILDRKLGRLATTASDKAITAGVRAMMTPIAKAMRSAVNAATVPRKKSHLKAEARKSIGSRFTAPKMGKRRGIKEAKVGFSVGKAGKAVKRAKAARGKRLAKGKGGGKGVGISAQNIHWFVLGTAERQHKSGHPTGKIDPVFEDVTRIAFAASLGASINAAAQKIKQVIHKEARKKG